ncbi:hypothetical protein BMS67_06705 [Leuconostoc mesenteroides subsp. cremoris]|nr:hypothetical protein BMS67_06705 [Leuconostoc mesenteroides subsp. cremoris]
MQCSVNSCNLPFINTIVILIIGSLLLGFNLSAADWQNFRRGIPLYLIVILFISTLQYLF